MKKTVIFGGTFNPIHLGHVEVVQSVLDLPTTKEVILIPSSMPPHKICNDLACDADRFEMCKLAVAGIDNTSVSDAEILRGGKSYTVDTLRRIKKQNPDASLAFVCGGDMVVTFKQWHKYSEIMELAEIIAVRREGISDAQFKDAVRQLINEGGRITVINGNITGISSTDIRENINNREYLLKYLTKEVYEYIRDNKLYSGESND